VSSSSRRRRSSGLRSQILVGLALVTLFAVSSAGYLALWAAGDSLRVQRESTALSLVAAAAVVATGALDPNQPIDSAHNRARLAGVMRGLTERGDITEASVMATDRTVLASRPERPPSDVDPPIVGSVLAGVPPVLSYRGETQGDGTQQLLAYAPVHLRATVAGAVRLVLPAEAPVMAVLRQSSTFIITLAVGDAILVLALGAFVLTQLVVAPLQAVETAAARVTAGDLTGRVSTGGPREIAALAEAFNRMTTAIAEQREQLIRTEKLASVGQLAAGVAHEIGNPLAAILGYADILRADADQAHLSPEERRDALARVKGETQRIHRIIQDLLDYSRPTHEEARSIDPLKVMEGAVALLRPQARFRGVEVGYLPSEIWPRVDVAPSRLTQVFVNLLLNAADAMAGAGRVSVSAVAVAATRTVRIALADQGPGVPLELRSKIFDPFFTTKAPGQGTGLGLPICRAIVETYRGTLEIEAPPDGAPGIVFVVTLPAAAAA